MKIMGVLNVTPDSFSDGGLHYDAQKAIEAGLRMHEEGADWVDVGGESTRPGAALVDEAEEKRRVLDVVEQLAQRGVSVSIDTRKPAVAREAVARGARFINDVTGFSNPEMVEIAIEAKCEVCVMHMQGTPDTMQQNPHYDDVVGEVGAFLVARAKALSAAGLKVWIDPGIGFGKTLSHNISLIRHLDRLVATGYPVLLGVSRKALIGKILGTVENPAPVEDRIEGSLAMEAFAQLHGVAMVRVHDVRAARRVATVIDVLHG